MVLREVRGALCRYALAWGAVLRGIQEKRYDGYLAGGGFTYGYDWILSPHWNLEAAIGIGYARLWYEESPRVYCEKCGEDKHKNYFGPTKAALSLIYIF